MWLSTLLLKKIFFILICCFTGLPVFAQTDTVTEIATTDTPVVKKTYAAKKPAKKRVIIDTIEASADTNSINVIADKSAEDSLIVKAEVDTNSLAQSGPIAQVRYLAKRPIDSFYLKMLDNPFLRATGKPVFLVISERKRVSKDDVFYLLAGLMFFFAFIKLIFSRYFHNIFRLFFQPTFRQKQTREQLLQSTFPSLLLNLFFIVSGGVYISFLITYNKLSQSPFSLIFIYSSVSLLILSLGKFFFLTFTGWVFNVQDATETYTFIVFLIYKILGVILIPFILLIAFSAQSIVDISIMFSTILIILIFVYRYLVSLSIVRRDIQVNPLHFLMYVCAFEITPLLLIYKTLTVYLT